ncbi:hypothetical protein [Streptomyces litchfieldiae]|uniref:Uncharacterized protein n=1 Tax=Streptomyces litchfieldiae TaxID=3075543 RepID=A0ABU2MSF2_9ACTN|nr:hypothetical protein [Streptomyces sp. DSM 44938]MDT0344386.1 hypothetical protein [Streptomyces sp. DSM 44938]
MPRRIPGDPAVPPWSGNEDERAALRAREAELRRWRERVDAALRVADFAAAEAAGHHPAAVRELARRNAESQGDLDDLARQLNESGLPGRAWDGASVAYCLQLLWPRERYRDWPRHQGRYPGYLGPLRDSLHFTMPSERIIGPRRHQYRCIRCDAQWPEGWPGTGSPAETRCPDCQSPNYGVGGSAEEHSIIDLHWLTFRYAPRPAEPCPVCGAAREMTARGYSDIPERVLCWSCPQADEIHNRGNPDSHFARSLTPAVWESTAAHYAYWLAVDALRRAAAAGEVTELPDGARYTALDGSGERWIRHARTGWERQADDERSPGT